MISCTNIVSCVNMRNSAFDLRRDYIQLHTTETLEAIQAERGFGGRWDKIRWRLNKAENKYHDAQNFIDRPPPSIDLSPWNHGDHYLLSNCKALVRTVFMVLALNFSFVIWIFGEIKFNQTWSDQSTAGSKFEKWIILSLIWTLWTLALKLDLTSILMKSELIQALIILVNMLCR